MLACSPPSLAVSSLGKQ